MARPVLRLVQLELDRAPGHPRPVLGGGRHTVGTEPLVSGRTLTRATLGPRLSPARAACLLFAVLILPLSCIVMFCLSSSNVSVSSPSSVKSILGFPAPGASTSIESVSRRWNHLTRMPGGTRVREALDSCAVASVVLAPAAPPSAMAMAVGDSHTTEDACPKFCMHACGLGLPRRTAAPHRRRRSACPYM